MAESADSEAVGLPPPSLETEEKVVSEEEEKKKTPMSVLLKSSLIGGKESLKKVPPSEIKVTLPFDSLFDLITYPSEMSDSISTTIPNGMLFIGPLSAACKRNHDSLIACDIQMVLSCCSLPKKEQLIKHPSHLIEYFFVDIDDSPSFDIHRFFQPTFELLDQYLSDKSKNCLVHCSMGVSRSATIVIAYLMRKFQMKRDVILKSIRKDRSCIQPNPRFMDDLLKLEEELGFITELC